MESTWLGHMEYRKALNYQMRCVEQRASGEIPDTLILLTHLSIIGRMAATRSQLLRIVP